MIHRRLEGMSCKVGLNWNISLNDLTLIWCTFDTTTGIATHKGFRLRWKIKGGSWGIKLYNYSSSYNWFEYYAFDHSIVLLTRENFEDNFGIEYNALHEEWKEGLQSGIEMGTHTKEESGKRSCPT